MRAMTALASASPRTLFLVAILTAAPVAASRDSVLASPRTFSLLAALTSVSAAARDSVSFDFGWKHRTGLHDWAPAGSEPPKDTDPGLRPPESAAKFDDAGWGDVQLPHDGLIANNSYSDCLLYTSPSPRNS